MKRRLNPRTCRACGKIFRPKTALQRYGNARCKRVGNQGFVSAAVPGARPTHPS